jgi:hypothetical protein
MCCACNKLKTIRSALSLICLCSGMLCLGACTEEILLELPKQEQEFVVNGLINDSELSRIFLTKTISITDDKFPVLDDALITISEAETGRLIDDLSYHKDYYYKGSQKINQYNKPINLNIWLDGEAIQATTYIPAPIPVLSADMVWPSGYDEYGDPLTEYQLSFQDPAGEENFYELFFFNYNYLEDIGEEYSSFYSNRDLAYTDPVIRAEGLKDYDNYSLLFSDQLFDGEKARIVVKYFSMAASIQMKSLVDTSQLEPQQSYALLRSVSRQYYDYRKSWIIHRYTQPNKPSALQQDPTIDDFSRFLFVGDPVNMKSTIANGVGVFAGYSQSLKKIQR